MTFGDALEYAKAGYRIYRTCKSWKNIFVYTDYTSQMTPYLTMCLQDNESLPYTVNCSDLFADDWETQRISKI